MLERAAPSTERAALLLRKENMKLMSKEHRQNIEMAKWNRRAIASHKRSEDK
jgi:hypothetical protein